MSEALYGGAALLERALTYALGTLTAVSPEGLARPTPCRGWDLRSLLAHLAESVAALTEALDTGQVDLGHCGDPAADPVAALRCNVRELLRALTTADRHPVVSVGGCPLTAVIVAGTGAVELAVHGWDVARACGSDRPIPRSLARELLDLAPLLVAGEDRPGRFAAPVPVPLGAEPGDRLLAFLGRQPYTVPLAAGPG